MSSPRCALTEASTLVLARLWARAIESEPGIVEDRQAQHLYNAACAAALASTGQGKDDPPPDEAERARLRTQARDWLDAELTAWATVAESQPKDRPLVVQTLRHWQADADLAGVRDPAALEAFPEAERAAWTALWERAGRLLKDCSSE
ncbi:MAG: hypothetical protein U0800_21720 [Isosphaeraceae bacterium]